METDPVARDPNLHARCAALMSGARAWDDATDVVVIGAGLAGHCAAIAAAEAGASVVLVEKLAEIGGSTVLSGGAMAFSGTDEQAAAGVEDSAERLFEDLRKIGQYRNDEHLVAAYVEHQLDTYRWLKQRGVIFRSVQLGGGQSVPRSNRVETRQMIAALNEFAVRRCGVILRCNAPVLALVGDAQAGLHGVFVRTADNHERALRARRGIVLASGGFSRSEALLEQFAPGQGRALRIGGAGNVGDGLRMARALGADIRDMAFIKGTFGMHPSAGPEDLRLIHAIYKGAIAVNRHGQRFIDESLSYKLIGDACLAQPDSIAYQIFDEDIMAQSVPGVATSDFVAARDKGLLVSAGTIEALAQAIGLSPTALAATVQRYNADVEAHGRDLQFGRDGLGNHFGKLRRIAQRPFHAYASTSAVLATYGGVAIDAQTRVLDCQRKPIVGLYAAGEVTGGVHGAAYMTGSSLGKSAIFGRIAGQAAATANSPTDIMTH